MNTGQTLFVVFGMILLSIFGLSVSRSTLHSRSVLQESSLLVSAISVGEKYIEESERFRFDENSAATIPSSFTYAGQLGPDVGESYPNFDDIDDYDGLTLVDTTSAHTPLNITIDVSYVNLSEPDTPITSRTYYKRIYVKVSSPYFAAMPDSAIKLNRVFGYHYFWSDQWD